MDSVRDYKLQSALLIAFENIPRQRKIKKLTTRERTSKRILIEW